MQQLAIQKPSNGIRANVILPGLMDTPMAVDTRARHSGKSRAEVAAMRDSHVPLRHKMGTAWDVANAALFLASDEANFITGVALAGRRRRAGQDRVKGTRACPQKRLHVRCHSASSTGRRNTGVKSLRWVSNCNVSRGRSLS